MINITTDPSHSGALINPASGTVVPPSETSTKVEPAITTIETTTTTTSLKIQIPCRT